MLVNWLDTIMPIIIGAVCTPFGAWVGSRLERRKYEVTIGTLKAELEAKLSDVKKTELDNVREANTILMETVVTPLKKEISTLRYGLNRLNRALEKIPSCHYANICPITAELQREEDEERAKTNVPKSRDG